jgi:hypothetical protein
MYLASQVSVILSAGPLARSACVVHPNEHRTRFLSAVMTRQESPDRSPAAPSRHSKDHFVNEIICKPLNLLNPDEAYKKIQ